MNAVTLCISTGQNLVPIQSIIHVDTVEKFVVAVEALVCHNKEFSPGFKTPRKWIEFSAAYLGYIDNGWCLFISVEDLQSSAKKHGVSIAVFTMLIASVSERGQNVSDLSVPRSVRSKKLMAAAPMKLSHFVGKSVHPFLKTDIQIELFAGWYQSPDTTGL